MAEKILTQKYFNGGIADSEKEGIQGAFYFGRKLDIFRDPLSFTVIQKTAKISSTTVVDLPKWIVSGAPYDTNSWAYGDAGHIYKITSGDSVSDERTVSNSGGQGMDVLDDYLYYMQDTQLGRYGPLSGGAAFTDNFSTGLTSTAGFDLGPVKAFNGQIYAGHGNNLLETDGTTTTKLKLVLPTGLYIRSLEVIDEFLVIGTQKGTDITKNDEGYLFFWDGSSTTYNFFVKVEEGGVGALLSSKNRLLSVLGTKGIIYANYSPFQRLQQIPFVGAGKYVDIFPGAVTVWQGIALFGFGGATDSASVYQGVYQWGTRNERYPECLNYAWEISTGTSQGTGMKIGSLKGLGNKLYIGWKDASNYGIDKVTIDAAPYAQGIMECLIFDDRRIGEDKLALLIKASHLALATNESIQLGYKKDRATNYTTDTANSTVDTIETRLPPAIADSRHREFQFEVLLNASSSTAPTVTGIGFKYNDLKEERDF